MKNHYPCFKIIFRKFHRNSVESVLSLKYRRLQKFKEHEALYGPNTEPAVLIQIEDLENEIRELTEELQSIPITEEPQKQKCQLLLIGGLVALIAIIGVVWAFRIKSLSVSDNMPVIKNFSIEYPNQETMSVNAGGVIEVRYGENVLIKSMTFQGDNGQLTWFIARGNKQLIAEGIKYIAPLEGNVDVLTVLAQSSHGVQETYASLHIVIVPD
jgi:hypothetical protein